MQAPAGRGGARTEDTGSERSRVAYWVCLLLVFATVSWRPNTFYAGGLDPVVIAKGLLSVIALSMAWNAFLQQRHRQPLRSRAIVFLMGYLGISTFGAWSTGNMFPSLILSVRVFIIALVMVLMHR